MRKNIAPMLVWLALQSILPAIARADEATEPEATAGSSEAHENALSEIVVTASRKRNEDVQTTPIAVTALSADTLERDHVTDFAEITSLAPNLQISKSLGAGNLANIYLRGFGQQSSDPAVDPRIAVFVDGIYQPSATGSLFDTFDVGQIEVDAGPQGTLLGKNAPVGAIYVTSARPSGRLDGEIEGDYGSYDHFGLHAKLDFPIVTDGAGTTILAGKVSISEKEGGNWVYNDADGKRDMGGENAKAGKLALSFTPDSPLEWDLIASVGFDRDPQAGEHEAGFLGGFPGTSSSATQTSAYPCYLPGLCPRTPYGTTDSTFTTRERDDTAMVSSTVSYRFTPVTLTSVSGYDSLWLDDNVDDGGTPYAALNGYHNMTHYDFESEELRLSSVKNGGWDFGGRLDWVAGGYFSNYNYHASENLGILDFPPYSGYPGESPLTPIGVPNVVEASNGTTQSEAAFLHVIYDFTEEWTGTFGVRQSWDHKTHSFQADFSPYYVSDIPGGWHNTSFEVGTAYQFDPSHLAYVRFAQGYESGGFNGFSTGNIFQEELNDAYEVGFKTDWLDRHLRVNLDFFLNDLSQLQIESAVPIPNPPYFNQETLNAGSATVEGFEAQIVAVPTEDLTTHLNVGYLHPKFNQNQSTICSNTLAPTDCSGLPFAYSPKWTIALGADYVRDLPYAWGTATFSAEWDYKSSLYTSDPVYPSSRQDGYGLVNLGVKFEDPAGHYAVEFYGTNVLNRAYVVGYTDASGVAGWQRQGLPAEWGLRLSYKFGQS